MNISNNSSIQSQTNVQFKQPELPKEAIQPSPVVPPDLEQLRKDKLETAKAEEENLTKRNESKSDVFNCIEETKDSLSNYKKVLESVNKENGMNTYKALVG